MDIKLLVFKLILLGFGSIIGYLFMFRLRSRFWFRLFLMSMTLAVAVFIINPAWATDLSKIFGIGRGVDFIFYLTHGLSIFSIIVLYIRNQELESSITKISRDMAQLTAKSPSR